MAKLRTRLAKQAAVFFASFMITLAACDTHLQGEPPLHKAAYKGDVEALEKLIEQGADLDARNSEGATALHWAAFKGHADSAELLIKSGANVNAVTTKGSTPLRLATTHKQEQVVKILERYGGRIDVY
ncbi:hypothetical protein NBRC116494_10570 [Aurantivibrio plasticivorans]